MNDLTMINVVAIVFDIYLIASGLYCLISFIQGKGANRFLSPSWFLVFLLRSKVVIPGNQASLWNRINLFLFAMTFLLPGLVLFVFIMGKLI